MKITKPSQLKATLALTKASLVSTFRNPSAVFFSFAFPFIFIVAFGLLSQGTHTFDVAVRKDSLKSGYLYEAFTKVDVLKLDTSKSDDEINQGLQKGQIPVAISISQSGEVKSPKGDSLAIYSLKVEYSAADPQNAQAVRSILSSIVESFNNPANPQQVKLIMEDDVLIEGRKYTAVDFILPGQLAFSLLMTAINGIAFTFISLRKQLVIKRIFATPVNRSTIIISEVISKIVMAVLQTLLIVLLGHFAFGFTLANGALTVVYMVILAVIGLITFMSFGLLVTTFGSDENAVAPAANLIAMPQFLLSGAFFPIDAFPTFLQPIAKIMPMTFLNDSLRKVAFEGAGLIDTLPQIVALLVWAVIVYIIVIKLFKWE